jgi:hypothetical protein
VVVSFIGGGDKNSRRKPPACSKSLQKTNKMIISLIYNEKDEFLK